MKTGAAMHSTKAAAVCPGAPTPLVERLLARTVDDGGCLVWQGAYSNGHPYHRTGNTVGPVRRTLYAATVAPINSRVIRMICNTPGCVNPDHIKAMTVQALNAELGALGVMGGAVRSASLQRHHRAAGITKLTPADVQRIRTSDESQRLIAKELGVSQSHVWRVQQHLAQKDHSSPFNGLGART